MNERHSLLVVADRNVTGIEQAARTLGKNVGIVTLSSAEITPERVREADLLFVRSTVRCGPQLLSGSRVRFVATATIGTDHLDLPWLASQGIRVASAPGCNADSVMQWLASALCLAAERLGGSLPSPGQGLFGLRAGVVGVGNVGSRAARLLHALGAEVLFCDPTRARLGIEDLEYHQLDELCESCDLLTLHVPLTTEGEDCTASLIDERRLRLMQPHAILINTSRGEVVDGAALLGARRAGHLRAVLLDVFPGEPGLDPALVEAALIATPHIAGHSLEGKINGTRMVYQAACEFLGVQPAWEPEAALLPKSPLDGTNLKVRGRSDGVVLSEILLRSYPIGIDDEALRGIARLPDGQRGSAFRRYRETYPARRELSGVHLHLEEPRSRLRTVLQALGADLR